MATTASLLTAFLMLPALLPLPTLLGLPGFQSADAAPAAASTASPTATAPASPAAPSYTDITDRSFQARDRYEAQPKNAEAAYNFAVYQTMVGDISYARQIFSKAVELKPDDFLSHLGLAQTIVNDPSRGVKWALPQLARAHVLALASANANRCEKLDQLGQTYLAIGFADKALPLYQKSYALQPTNRQVLQMLMRSALAAKNFPVANAHLPALRAGSVTDSQLLLALAANYLTMAPAGPKLDQFIVDQAKANFAIDADLFYRLGRRFETAKKDAAASQCYSKAAALVPDEAQFVLAYCARLVLDNRRPEAVALLKELAAKTPGQEPSPRRAALAVVVPKALALLQKPEKLQKTQVYKASVMEFSLLSCNCKITAFNYLLRHLPGVVYARIVEGRGLINLIVYDPAITTAEKVWSKLGRNVATKIAPKIATKAAPGADGTAIADFPSLVHVVLANYELEPQPARKFYDFAPLPLLPEKI